MNKVALASFAFVASALFAACDKNPTAPTPPTGPTLPAGPPTVRSIAIAGPEVVDLGATGQFRAMAQLTDGSSRDVTAEVNWSSFYPMLEIVGPGLVKGNASGETAITVEFAGRGANRVVMVLPAGTYRLMGRITEAAAISGPVVGALVEVTTAGGVRLNAQTGSAGGYRVYGVANATTVRVVKDGYQSVTQSIGVPGGHATHDIALALLASRADVSGNYTMTITAASNCGVGLGEGRVPEEARVRSYQAAVQQDGPALVVTLDEPTLAFGRTGFPGRVEPGRVVFNLSWQDGESPILIDQLPTSNFLVVHGSATATVTTNRLAGLLSGAFQTYENWNAWGPAISSCSSANHLFVLAR